MADMFGNQGQFTASDISNFIAQNINNPQAIVNAANQYGISAQDIQAAAGFTPQQQQSYLTQSGLSPTAITGLPGVTGGGTTTSQTITPTTVTPPVVTTPITVPGQTTTPTTVTPAPTTTPATSPGGSFTQGAALPNITTTQTQSTAAPTWYTDYLSNIAKQGEAAARGAQYIGAQPLQEQAFRLTGEKAGQYAPAIEQGMGLTTKAAGLSSLAAAQPYMTAAGRGAYEDIGKYMSPYVEDVVKQIGALGQRQIQQNLAPGVTSGLVGAGQFGSKRGAEALGQAIRDAQQNILAQQSTALQSGYGQALQAAQADLARQANLAGTAGTLSGSDIARQLSAGQQLGALGQAGQAMNLADINALATLGQQQQAIKQNEQLFQLQQLANQAGLLRGYSIPTSVSSSYTGPIPGAYAASPLQQISGIAALLAGISQYPFGKAAGQAVTNLMGKIPGLSDVGNIFSGSSPVDLTRPEEAADWWGGFVKDGGHIKKYRDGGDVRGYATAGSVSGLPFPTGALSETPAGQAYMQELQNVLDVIQKQTEAGPNLFKIAGAFLDPGRTGSFGESVGRVSTSIGEDIVKQQERMIPLAQAKATLAGQRFQAEKAQASKQSMQNILQPVSTQDESGLEKTTYKINPNAVRDVLKSSDDPIGDLTKISDVIPKMRKAGMLTDLSGDVTTPFDAIILMAGSLGSQGPAYVSQAQRLAKQYQSGLIDEDKANTLANQMMQTINSSLDRKTALENTQTMQEFQRLLAMQGIQLSQERLAEIRQQNEKKLTDEQKITYNKLVSPIINEGLKANSALLQMQQIRNVVEKAPSGVISGGLAKSVGALFGTDENTALRNLENLSKALIPQIPRLPGAASNLDSQNLEKSLGQLYNPMLTNQQRRDLINEIVAGFERLADRAYKVSTYWDSNKAFDPSLLEKPPTKPGEAATPLTGQPKPTLRWDPATNSWK